MPDRMVKLVRASLVAVIAAVCIALSLPLSAGAATVVNGDFEAGSLNGWTVVNSEETGASWFAYSGTAAPYSDTEIEKRTVPPPPQGNFAAISDQTGPGTHLLYQDVALESGATHSLSMLVYYQSSAAISVPTPDTLSSTGTDGEAPAQPNQQYRIDVMKPSAPVYSVSPSDILATVFRTNAGDPQALSPITITTDLTPFAGQTVRLRIAEVDNLSFFNAGADAVSITSIAPSPPPPPPSNLFEFGKLLLNKKKGTGRLQVKVPGPGTLTLVDVRATVVNAGAGVKAPRSNRVKRATVLAAGPGTAILKVRPTATGRKALKRNGKLKFKALVTFTPNGGTAASQKFSGRLKSNLSKGKGSR